MKTVWFEVGVFQIATGCPKMNGNIWEPTQARAQQQPFFFAHQASSNWQHWANLAMQEPLGKQYQIWIQKLQALSTLKQDLRAENDHFFRTSPSESKSPSAIFRSHETQEPLWPLLHTTAAALQHGEQDLLVSCPFFAIVPFSIHSCMPQDRMLKMKQ